MNSTTESISPWHVVLLSPIQAFELCVAQIHYSAKRKRVELKLQRASKTVKAKILMGAIPSR
jgi:hypothetical protein